MLLPETFHDAELLLLKETNGVTIGNTSNASTTASLLNVMNDSEYRALKGMAPPPKRCRIGSERPTITENNVRSSDKRVLVNPEILEKIVSSLTKLKEEMGELKETIKTFQHVVNARDENMAIKFSELMNIILNQKTDAERANIMTLENLLEKHNIKTILNPEDPNPGSRPVFASFDSFKRFDDHPLLMKNEVFQQDLIKYFKTAMDGREQNFVSNLRAIFKIFFDDEYLHNSFTGQKQYRDKLVFKNTNFGKCLTGKFYVI